MSDTKHKKKARPVTLAELKKAAPKGWTVEENWASHETCEGRDVSLYDTGGTQQLGVFAPSMTRSRLAFAAALRALKGGERG